MSHNGLFQVVCCDIHYFDTPVQCTSLLNQSVLTYVVFSNDKMANTCLNSILKSDWLMSDTDKSCDFVKAKYLEVMLKCWASLRNETKMVLKEKIQSFAEKCLQSKNTTYNPSKVIA